MIAKERGTGSDGQDRSLAQYSWSWMTRMYAIAPLQEQWSVRSPDVHNVKA